MHTDTAVHEHAASPLQIDKQTVSSPGSLLCCCGSTNLPALDVGLEDNGLWHLSNAAELLNKVVGKELHLADVLHLGGLPVWMLDVHE